MQQQQQRIKMKNFGDQYERTLKQHIEQPSKENIQVTKEIIFERLKIKKRNWSSRGKDKIMNFCIKRMKVFHQDISTALNVIIAKRLDIPSWLTSGRSVMIPKKDKPSTSDYINNDNNLETS